MVGFHYEPSDVTAIDPRLKLFQLRENTWEHFLRRENYCAKLTNFLNTFWLLLFSRRLTKFYIFKKSLSFHELGIPFQVPCKLKVVVSNEAVVPLFNLRSNCIEGSDRIYGPHIAWHGKLHAVIRLENILAKQCRRPEKHHTDEYSFRYGTHKIKTGCFRIVWVTWMLFNPYTSNFKQGQSKGRILYRPHFNRRFYCIDWLLILLVLESGILLCPTLHGCETILLAL